MRALIVEDDPISWQVLSRHLSSFAECELASDGKEAISVFRDGLENENPYSIVCVDIMMPGMDGHVVLKELRAIEKEFAVEPKSRARILITSALDDSPNVIGAFSEGSDGYLTKPITREKLEQELRRLSLVSQ